MKTTIYLSLFVFLSLFVIVPESRGKETVKIQNAVNANQSKSGHPSEFSLSIQVKQKDTIQVKQKDNSSKEKEIHHLKVGKAVYVVATVVNVSQHKLYFIETDPKVDFHLTVLDSKGKPVPKTQYGNRILQRQTTEESRRFLRISKIVLPGESLQYEFNLSRQFDLSLVGTYSVQASCKVLKKKSGREEIKSKAVTFELQ